MPPIIEVRRNPQKLPNPILKPLLVWVPTIVTQALRRQEIENKEELLPDRGEMRVRVLLRDDEARYLPNTQECDIDLHIVVRIRYRQDGIYDLDRLRNEIICDVERIVPDDVVGEVSVVLEIESTARF